MLSIYLPITFVIFLKFLPFLRAPFHLTADIQPTSFHIIPWFKSSCEEAPVYLALVLIPVCSLSLSGLSGLHWKLGSNLPARGCVSCVGAVAQSICLHQWAGAAVGLGQQDPAKHQLLAAFYTDSHQVGHIYSTASSPVRLEDLSALSAWIFIFSHVVLFCLLDSQHHPQPVLYVPIHQSLCHSVCLCGLASLILQNTEVNMSA